MTGARDNNRGCARHKGGARDNIGVWLGTAQGWG